MLHEVIARKFRGTKYDTVKEWWADSKCPLSVETCTGVINRNREPSVAAFITMAYLLGMKPSEIAQHAKAAGDTVFWRLISPVELSDTEADMLAKFRRLTPEKQNLVANLIDTMEV